MEYDVISEIKMVKFIREVNRRLGEGWHLVGGYTFFHCNGGRHQHRQAMCRQNQ